jgi:hypothetical protein
MTATEADRLVTRFGRLGTGNRTSESVRVRGLYGSKQSACDDKSLA